MTFSKAEEEPGRDLPEEERETEISETAYMGEGKSGRSADETEVSETAYMGEPEERHESKHETEYRRHGPHRGKAMTETHATHHHGEGKEGGAELGEGEEKGESEEAERAEEDEEDRSPEPGTPDFWPSTELGQDENWEPPARNKPDSAPWREG